MQNPLDRPWFYRFELPDGTSTVPYLEADVATIHEARRDMALRTVRRTFDDLSQVDVLDLACHQGYFAIHLLQAGVRHVHGVDVRPAHLEDAALMADVLGVSERLRLSEVDVASPGGALGGLHDVVLVLGLLYHVENPVGLLRTARAHTRRLCLVETQIAPSLSGVTDWGSYRNSKQIVGNFAIVDEEQEVSGGNREANTTSVSLFPDLHGLLHLMRAVGFDRVEVVPPDDRNEQLANGKRAMVAGWVGP